MNWKSLMVGMCDDLTHGQKAYCAHRTLVMGRHIDHGIRIVGSGATAEWAQVFADLLNEDKEVELESIEFLTSPERIEAARKRLMEP